MKRYLLRSIVILVVALVGCSVEIAQTVEVPTPFPTIAPLDESLATITPFPTVTPLAARPEDLAGSGQSQSLATPTPLAPLNLSGLSLTGRLVVSHGQQGIVTYDLTTDQNTTLFQPPDQGLVLAATVSADGSLIAMAYAPPPAQGEIQLGYTGLYVLPVDGSGGPQLLLQADANNIYFGPAWSPDGRFLYYCHFVAGRADPAAPPVVIERVAYPGGQPEVVLDNGLWPTLSPDGATLAYVASDFVNFVDELYVAGADGSNPHRVMAQGIFPAVDAPQFSPDGGTLLFSAVGGAVLSSSRSSSLARWLAPRVASAHAVPSDLWSVPVAGGEPTRLTQLGDVGIKADYSADGRTIAFVTGSSGIVVMNADGTELTRLLDQPGLNTLEWIP